MIHFCSLNAEWIQEIQSAFSGIQSVRVSHADIRTISQDRVAFVSPANSLGFMDGGIDLHLSRTILPGIEPAVKRAIRTIGMTTAIGRAYLPVGSALFVKHNELSGLIVAPTMFLPHIVADTQNAYHSFYAALHVWKSACPTWDLIVTSHCCGVGGMRGTRSAEQMKAAYTEFLQSTTMDRIKIVPYTYYYDNKDLEQPDNYDNREIKELYMTREEVLSKIIHAKITL